MPLFLRNESTKGCFMENFWQSLQTQRWDDHRFYHHSRINQSLHFLSAISFLTAYVVAFKNPALAALIGWGIAMVSRQSGHFFFEPKGFDEVNRVTHEHKEAIKVGYNLKRKVVLHVVWALSPLLLWVEPTLFGWVEAAQDPLQFAQNVGTLWLVVGIGGLLFRTLQLFFIRDVQTGLVWLTKIITDPFHDLLLYRKAPLQLLRGELMDPMDHAKRA
jgi:hypothetical protein